MTKRALIAVLDRFAFSHAPCYNYPVCGANWIVIGDEAQKDRALEN